MDAESFGDLVLLGKALPLEPPALFVSHFSDGDLYFCAEPALDSDPLPLRIRSLTQVGLPMCISTLGLFVEMESC
jgi:hypothetical protein